MTDKPKTIQEALAEVQRKINEYNWDEKDFSAEKNFPDPKKPEVSSKPKPAAPKAAAKPGVVSTIGKTIARNPKTALAGAAIAAGTAALGSDGIQKVKQFGKDVWHQATTGEGPTPVKDAITGKSSSATPASSTPAATSDKTPTTSTAPAPAPAAETKTETKPKPMSFSQAFKSAREKATAAGNPSTGQFDYQGKKYQTNVAGEKYVPAAQQTSVEPKTDNVPLPPSRISRTVINL